MPDLSGPVELLFCHVLLVVVGPMICDCSVCINLSMDLFVLCLCKLFVE